MTKKSNRIYGGRYPVPANTAPRRCMVRFNTEKQLSTTTCVKLTDLAKVETGFFLQILSQRLTKLWKVSSHDMRSKTSAVPTCCDTTDGSHGIHRSWALAFAFLVVRRAKGSEDEWHNLQLNSAVDLGSWGVFDRVPPFVMEFHRNCDQGFTRRHCFCLPYCCCNDRNSEAQHRTGEVGYIVSTGEIPRVYPEPGVM